MAMDRRAQGGLRGSRRMRKAPLGGKGRLREWDAVCNEGAGNPVRVLRSILMYEPSVRCMLIIRRPSDVRR